MHSYSFQDRLFSFERYPATDNHSLRPWSAADEYLLQRIEPLLERQPTIAVYHDRFGFLWQCLHPHQRIAIAAFKSQEKAWAINQQQNQLDTTSPEIHYPLDSLNQTIDIALVRVPKSIDLFQLYLEQIHTSLADDGVVLVGFMTKYFSTQMLQLAESYFEEVEQSKAWKKARVLRLRKKKAKASVKPIHHLNWVSPAGKPTTIQQYYGVFSAKKIDYASQLLIDHLSVQSTDQKVLDVASGNGILAKAVREHQPHAELHLMDDSWLAIESSRLNLAPENTHFHYSDTLDEFSDDSFDLVVSNPPFHFEHENNIEVALSLFKDVARCLKPTGRFVLVANRHLNYRTHLTRLFTDVQVLVENQRYTVFECKKQLTAEATDHKNE